MNHIKRLPESQELVMAAMWETNERCTAETIRVILSNRYGKDLKIQTVYTLLNRLKDKKYLIAEKPEKRTYYIVQVTKEEYRKEILKEIVSLFYKGDELKLAAEITQMI